MKVYKWNKLTNDAACIVGSLGAGCWTSNNIVLSALSQSIEQVITKQPVKSWRENTKDIVKKAQAVCDNWDIRQAKTLFDIFPQLIAKKYRGKTPTADYDDKDDWVIIFA